MIMAPESVIFRNKKKKQIMLPEIQNQEHLFTIPKSTVSNDDVKNLTNELKAFHEILSDCFHRSKSRGHFFRYMGGQFSDLERK